MNRQIPLLVLVIALTATTTYFVSRPKPDTNPYYLREINNSIKREDSIKTELNKSLQEINRIKSTLNEKDSIIQYADARELDTLFSDFFNRLK